MSLLRSMNLSLLNYWIPSRHWIKPWLIVFSTWNHKYLSLSVTSVVLTGEELPTLTLLRVTPAQLVFVQPQTLRTTRQHVEGLLTLAVPHFNSHLLVTTLMFVVEWEDTRLFTRWIPYRNRLHWLTLHRWHLHNTWKPPHSSLELRRWFNRVTEWDTPWLSLCKIWSNWPIWCAYFRWRTLLLWKWVFW